MNNRITVHCDVMGARGDSEFFWRNTTSDWIFMLNGNAGAIDDALRYGKKVAVRWFDPFGDYNGGSYPDFDNQFHSLHTPEDTFARLVHSEYAKYKDNPNVYFILGVNEPTNANREDLIRVIDWNTRWGRLCAQAGYGALLGGYAAPKTFNLNNDPDKSGATEHNIDDGIWDAQLRVADKYHDKIIVMTHVYTAIRAWQELTGSDFYNSEAMQNPPQGKHIQWRRQANGNYFPQYHVGRDAVLHIRMRELGLRVRFAVSECVLDNMPDIEHLLKPLHDRFHVREFESQPFRGIRSLRALYAYWYGRPLSDEEFGVEAFKDLKFLDEEYPPEYEFFAMFAGDFGVNWITYNVFHPEMNELLWQIIEYNREETKPVFNYEPVYVNVLVPTLNVRSVPYGNVITVLFGGFQMLDMDDINAVEDGAYVWLPVRVNGKEGWSAFYKKDFSKVYIEEMEEAPTEPPIEPPVPPTEPHEHTTEEQISALFDEHILDYYKHFSNEGIPRPAALVITRALRWLANLVEETLDTDEES